MLAKMGGVWIWSKRIVRGYGDAARDLDFNAETWRLLGNTWVRSVLMRGEVGWRCRLGMRCDMHLEVGERRK